MTKIEKFEEEKKKRGKDTVATITRVINSVASEDHKIAAIDSFIKTYHEGIKSIAREAFYER